MAVEYSEEATTSEYSIVTIHRYIETLRVVGEFFCATITRLALVRCCGRNSSRENALKKSLSQYLGLKYLVRTIWMALLCFSHLSQVVGRTGEKTKPISGN